MAIGRVGTDDERDIGMLDTVEVLRPGACAEGGLQPVPGRRVAHASAGIDIVGAKDAADHLLDQEGLFIGTAARGDPAQRPRTVFRLDPGKTSGSKGNRLVPRNFSLACSNERYVLLAR